MSGIQRRIFKVVSVVLLFALVCGIAYMPMNINAQAQQQIVFKKNENSYDSYINKYKNAILDCTPDAKPDGNFALQNHFVLVERKPNIIGI